MYRNECLVCEFTFRNRRLFLVSIYRTLNQWKNECDAILVNFEEILTYLLSLKPHLPIAASDFNVRSSSLRSDDIDTL